MSQDIQVNTITTSPHTITVSETIILVDVAGPASVVLPTGSAGNVNRSYFIKDVSGNAVKNPITITANGGRKIDDVSFAIINGGYSHIHVVSDGTNWYTI